jgi:hypothetical protein
LFLDVSYFSKQSYILISIIGVVNILRHATIYTTVITMVALTTIITPIWLKKSYMNESNLTPQTSSTSGEENK